MQKTHIIPSKRMSSKTQYMALRRPGRSRWPPSWLRHRSRPALLTLALLILIPTIPFFLGYSYYLSIINEGPIHRSHGDAEYTIVLLSQPRRLKTLRMVLAHYGRCPSLKEIVVVWGNDPVPDKGQLLSRVPVRVRPEVVDGLNNRFKPDPLISTDAVLSLDDDTLLWCSDIEAGFKEWQRTPDALVGFIPRLIEVPSDGSSTSAKVHYLGEREAYQRGQYNTILTGAMFYNVALMSEYWDLKGFPAMGRSVVDKIGNCEDILMNYIAAARIGRQRDEEKRKNGSYETPKQVVKYVRARRRLDVSQLTSVGISRNSAAHLAKREQCTADFAELVRSSGLKGVTPELPREKFIWSRRVTRPLCWVPGLGCIYL